MYWADRSIEAIVDGFRPWTLRTSSSAGAASSGSNPYDPLLMIRCLVALAGAAVLLAAVGAGAQELRGRLVGAVTDTTGAVLPGVTVTASSPALIRDRVVATGSQGGYVFPALPTGDYAVTFSLPGFRTVGDNGHRRAP